MSRLTRITIMLAAFFALDKVVAFIRQVIIARQFGLSAELDSFNVANNVPDMLYALISGGALAIAFIPVLSEVLTKKGRPDAWKLFSRIANLGFLVTASFAVLVAIFADALVGWELGVAPGFDTPQQELVIQLMRLNLIGTIIFSISGLVMAGLQANQHFFLPALAPIFYNIGQIFGALILAPEEGFSIGGFTLPSFGLGVHGLVYGVIIGAFMHLAIQIPGLLRFKFRWTPGLGLKNEDVKSVLRLMGPRLITMLFIQLIFVVRDNLASRLAPGSVTALTYGWMIQQVPETLIGTAIGTALLPTLSEHMARQERERFHATIERAIQVLIAITIPVAAILSLSLRPFISTVFKFGVEGTGLMVLVTAGYLAGLTAHSIKEVAARSFYAQKNAVVPMITAGINLALYVLVGTQLYRLLDAPGISLTDSIVYTVEVVILVLLLNRHMISPVKITSPILRALLAAGLSAGAIVLIIRYLSPVLHPLMIGTISLLAGVLISIPLILKEIRLLIKL